MKIAVIGGDKRMLFAARAFADDGHEVCLAGFDDLFSLCAIRICDWEQAVKDCDIAVLPVRPLSNGCLNAPFHRQRIEVAEWAKSIGSTPVFTGCAEQIAPYAAGAVYDYAVDEDFTWRNAGLTAEGAIGILLNEYEGSLCGCDILVTGFGRIGKCLSISLKALGAQVTVAVRRQSDRSMARQFGLNSVDFTAVDHARYPVIINTVPALVLDADAVDRMLEDVFLIDLASRPGGINFDRAKKRGLTCIHALSLPGKTAPLAAGTIIKDTIMNIVTREGICPVG